MNTHRLFLVAPRVLLLLALAVGAGARSAQAQVFVELTLESADDALGICDQMVRDLVAGRLQQRTLDLANKKLAAAQLDLTRQTIEMKKTLEALGTNVDANRKEIDALNVAMGRAQYVKVRLQRLQAHTGSIEGLKEANVKGTFGRILEEAKAQAGTGKATLDSVNEKLRNTGSEQVGTLTVDKIKVYEGDMTFFVQVRGKGDDWSNDWVEMKEGEDVQLFQEQVIPIRIRASLRDPQRKRLEESRDEARDVKFLDVTDAPPGVKFVYNSTSGTSTWVANNTYTWKKEAAAASSAKIKAFSARNSCRFSKGDILEVYPFEGTVQKMEFTVQANCAEWTRTSQLNGKGMTRKVEPEDGIPWAGSAYLVFSLFPK